MREATSMGSYLSHNPDPIERKSGIPEGVEIPAPVNATADFALRMSSAAPMISVLDDSEFT
jgi:hypothetical protein